MYAIHILYIELHPQHQQIILKIINNSMFTNDKVQVR